MSQTVADLSARLSDLHDSLKQTIQLIQRLSTLHISADGTATSDSADEDDAGDDTEADLSSDIHESLNQAEQDLELLKLDIEDFILPSTHRRGGARNGERERESNNLSARSIRLTEDIAL